MSAYIYTYEGVIARAQRPRWIGIDACFFESRTFTGPTRGVAPRVNPCDLFLFLHPQCKPKFGAAAAQQGRKAALSLRRIEFWVNSYL